jgi:hypothetical protein
MGVKPEKKLNKTQLKLLKLKEKIEPSVVDKPIDACSAFPLGNDKPIIDKPNNKPVIKPLIFRNENGFYCI